jgi:hypothetical protein
VKDVVFKAVTFTENGNEVNGHYFYDSPHDSDYEKICGVKGLTLPKAMSIMIAKGLDPIKNFKISIKVYYVS